MKKNSLAIQIWKYLVLFSIVILAFLWFFQVIFLKSYYKSVKKNELYDVSKTIINNLNTNNLSSIIDNISYDKSICIEITDSNGNKVEESSFMSRGCMMMDPSSKNKENSYKSEFINSNLDEKLYELINPRFDNETLVYAIKLDNNKYAFINTSIDPMDSTTSILKNQLVWVTIVVLILSFIVAFFISRHISNPIIKINKAAKKMANGDYKFSFDKDGNIKEINELVDTLNYTRDELLKTDELRRDLMANVSHDLKTPLTMIKAYAEMARDLNIDNKEKIKENMNVVIEEVDRLTILVNDILELSKLQSDIENLNIEEFDLIELINNVLNRYKIYSELESYKFKFSHKDKKLLIKADKKKIEQVIYNLVNNAINYTGEDNLVEIKITNNDEILVEIIDTGKGIKEEDINHIWDRYYKNKKKHKRNLIGTGLGLSIVKNILEEHKFKYGVKSKPNKGTTFYFIINKNL